MNIVRALISAVCVIWVAAAVCVAAPAVAGGPTSVLISLPGEGRSASLTYADAEYDQLMRLVGAQGLSLPRAEAESTPPDETGAAAVTLTWLIHDIDPWRVDRVYLDAESGPWIATQVMDAETGAMNWDGPVVWHQPSSGKELSMLLDEVLGGVPSSAPEAAAMTPATPGSDPASGPASAGQGYGVWWALGGAAGGILLTMGWLRLRRDPETGPETDPGTVPGTDSGADWLEPQTRSTSA